MTRAEIVPAAPRGWPALVAAADVIRRAAERQVGICVWGHDDVDGAAAAAILCEALRAAPGVSYYIPPRTGAHYGLDAAVIDRLAAGGTGLIVTVDCGITSVTEADHARARGIGLVITDHHEPPKALPAADAVVNPKIRQPGAPCPDLSGAGVALYLAALVAGTEGTEWLAAKPRLLAWAALATVSDRVPLAGENRAILAAGLPLMAADPALADMAAAIGLDLSRGLSHRIVSDSYAALLSGAVSRGAVHPAVEALNGRSDPAEIGRLWTAQLDWRRRLAEQAEAKKRRLNPQRDSINLVVDEDLPPGMIGPLAGRLRDATGFPAVVLGLKNGLHVGECRGFEPFDLAAMLRALAANLVQSGGHKQAAGFTVKPDRLGETLVAIEEYAEAHRDQIRSAVPPAAAVRRFRRPADIRGIAEQLAAAAPYGPGNPCPACEIAEFPAGLPAGADLWLDDPALDADGETRAATVSVDATHTGRLSVRILLTGSVNK